MVVKEFYGLAMNLSDDGYYVNCLMQEGTDNSEENSNLCERVFPYSAMQSIITNPISDDNYIQPQQLFKVKITECIEKVDYHFSHQSETDEVMELFKSPDYFKDFKNFDFLHS